MDRPACTPGFHTGGGREPSRISGLYYDILARFVIAEHNW